ncbi:MAG TPA: site-specific integrase [Streptosporangiaceae bacterium]
MRWSAAFAPDKDESVGTLIAGFPAGGPQPPILPPQDVVSLLAGIRTEEARALIWSEVDLDAGTVAVYRSVRVKGDTKTRKSRRVLKLPERAVESLKEHRTRQAAERLRAGGAWQDHGLVFCREDGTSLDRWQVRREFAAITKAAGLGEEWAPRELRHSFVSILSAHGVRIEDISDLVGHSGTTVTETVYRHEIRPALTTGPTAIDKILAKERTPPRLSPGEPVILLLPSTQPPATRPGTRRTTPAKPRPRRRA